MRIARALVLCLLPSLAAAQSVQPVEILHEFTASPSRPDGPLLQVPDGSFYGVMSDAIYRLASNGQVTIVARLTENIGASGALVRDAGGMLYGTTRWGGDGGNGTVYRFDPATGEVRILHAFTAAHEGVSPEYGLTLAGGFLYGVTTSTLFRVDPATGATTILYTFGQDGLAIYAPSSPVTQGADGFLYGTTRLGPGVASPVGGVLYRFDPATGAVTIVHAFTDLHSPEGRLLLGNDGRLYGSAGGPGPSGAGGIYRFAPATSAYEVLHTSASITEAGPGPLVMTADGSLFGTTTASRNAVPIVLSTIFRLRPSGGGYAYEALGPAGLGERGQLTIGSDGLLYGFTQEAQGLADKNGTIYRFDPATGGSSGTPFAITLLHDFPATTVWAPTEPVVVGATSAYGTTGRPGYGSVYHLNPATGAVTIVATIPQAHKFLLATSQVVGSPLVLGPSGAFFATVSATPESGGPGGGPDTSIVRFDLQTGVSRRQNGLVSPSPVRPGFIDTPMVHVPAPDFFSGDLFFARGRTVYRYNNNSDTLTSAGSGPDPGPFGESASTRLVVAGDGQVYVGILTSVEQGDLPISFETTARVFRVNRASNTLDLIADLGTTFGMTTLAAAPGGNLYVGAYYSTSVGGGSEIRLLNTTTGTHAPVCVTAAQGLEHMTALADGGIVGLLRRPGTQRLLLCNPANGLTAIRALPATVGALTGPLVEANGYLYGATFATAADYRSLGTAAPAPRQPGGALIRLSLTAAPLTLDTEGDGLPNRWESAYGLDPFDGSGDNGAAGDPDGDGRTNAQELAEGTHPRGVVTRYFAEGATGPFFRTRLQVSNPNQGRAAIVQMRFLTDDGARVAHDVVVEGGSSVPVDPSALPGLAHATFSTVVESDATIAVDRTMTWGASDYGSHLETGVTAAATTWYLAEGSTSGPFALFYLLQNPQASAVTATVRYLRPSGQAPIERTYTLLPNSRTTIIVDDQGAELASTDVSAVITAPSPIVAERAMYYSQPGQPFAAGHESAGVTAPALEWFLAEGATGAFFDLFVLIANPNPTAAVVDVEYLLVGGGSLTKTYTVAASSRSTIWVDDEQLPAGSGTKPLASAALSMIVRSTNGVPIVVERTMWWPGPSLTTNYWYESHNSPGATTTATRWLVAGAEIGGAAGAQTYVLIANPGATAGLARLSVLTSDGRFASGANIVLPAKSRTSVPFANPVPIGSGAFVGILVESMGTTPVPIVVEHANYSSPDGVLWGSGGNALAAPLP